MIRPGASRNLAHTYLSYRSPHLLSGSRLDSREMDDMIPSLFAPPPFLISSRGNIIGLVLLSYTMRRKSLRGGGGRIHKERGGGEPGQNS